VEIQVIGDQTGRVVHLGERECSIQRRHQKLIEEAPSTAVTPALRRAMGAAAIRAAEAVGYVNAGTCEFLLLPGGEFYFLEMNTRLQVEHPVTELVYGVDIVRQQLRVAQGQRLALPRRALSPRGCAIECRITSEDPFADFLPAGGVVAYLRLPGGHGVRWDGWIEQGTDVPLFYDSLLGKLIAWAGTRERAVARARRALGELVVVGLPTSREFHLRVLAEPSFQRGDIDIEYWDRVGRSLMARAPAEGAIEVAAVAAALLSDQARPSTSPRRTGDGAAAGAWGTTGSGTPWLDAARREGLR
jgi:acetyl-CoA carboxylase biotin carboxylase subunit